MPKSCCRVRGWGLDRRRSRSCILLKATLPCRGAKAATRIGTLSPCQGTHPAPHKLIADQEATIQTLATTRNATAPAYYVTATPKRLRSVRQCTTGDVARTICSRPAARRG